MNVTDDDVRRRPAMLAAGALAVLGVLLFARSVVFGDGLEVVLLGLGLLAGAAVIALLGGAPDGPRVSR
jgi:hypothetical protein